MSERRIIDHGIEVDFHSPCEKDLRVSYLEQYEINAAVHHHTKKPVEEDWENFEANKVHTKNTIKDITQKYGFFWDQKGKLMKKTDQLNRKSLSPNSTSPLKNKTLSVINRVPTQSPKPPKIRKLIEEESAAKQSTVCSQIDKKINSIIKKYSPSKTNSTSQEKSHNLSYCQRYLESSNQSFCSHDRQTSNVPYFGNSLQRNGSHHQFSINILQPEENPKIQEKPKLNTQSFTSKALQGRQVEVSFRRKSKFGCMETENTCNKKDQELDEKIMKITDKIKQCERQKQIMHIDFKKFDERVISRSKSPHAGNNRLTKNRSLFSKKERILTNDNQEQHHTAGKLTQHEHITLKDEDKYSVCTKTSKSICPNDRIEDHNFHPQDQTTYNNPSKSHKAALESKNIEAKLLDKFSKQIDLDEELRNAKIWFENNEDPHKWGILADKLEREGSKVKYRDLVEMFSSNTEEHNPFFSIKESFQSYLTLINKQRTAETHWTQEIENQLEERDFEEAGFNMKELDIEMKGSIRVEDLVRFINMRTKNFYRSRDLILIFTRLTGKNKKEVHFSQMLRKLGKGL